MARTGHHHAEKLIGKSYGLEITFPMADGTEPIRVFTTRQDTIYGATFMLVAAEHPLVMQLAKASLSRRTSWSTSNG